MVDMITYAIYNKEIKNIENSIVALSSEVESLKGQTGSGGTIDLTELEGKVTSIQNNISTLTSEINTLKEQIGSSGSQGKIQSITVNGIEMEVVDATVNFELATEKDIDTIVN